MHLLYHPLFVKFKWRMSFARVLRHVDGIPSLYPSSLQNFCNKKARRLIRLSGYALPFTQIKWVFLILGGSWCRGVGQKEELLLHPARSCRAWANRRAQQFLSFPTFSNQSSTSNVMRFRNFAVNILASPYLFQFSILYNHDTLFPPVPSRFQWFRKSITRVLE